jgi:phosphoribosylformylglycinamidine synthase
MSISSSYGAMIKKPQKLTNLFKYFFGEDQGRYLLEVEPSNLTKVEKSLKDSNIYYENIGFTQKDFLEIEGELKINIKDLFKINNEWYNNY